MRPKSKRSVGAILLTLLPLSLLAKPTVHLSVPPPGQYGIKDASSLRIE